MNDHVTAPFFARDGDHWHPSGMAKGPFGGLHGGAVSGLLVAELEALAASQGWGRAVSATTYLVRPAPLQAMHTEWVPVRAGGRLSVIENQLVADGKVQTKASVCFLKDAAIAGLPDVEAAPDSFMATRDIDRLSAWEFQQQRFFKESFLDAMDVRQGDGMVWVKPLHTLTGAAHPLSTVMSIADFSTLFYVVNDDKRPAADGWPNADLSVHIARPPVGTWIGVKSRSSWHSHGTGLTESELFDCAGWFGRSCQSVVLLPPRAAD